jgi:hypothetical protein
MLRSRHIAANSNLLRTIARLTVIPRNPESAIQYIEQLSVSALAMMRQLSPMKSEQGFIPRRSRNLSRPY